MNSKFSTAVVLALASAALCVPSGASASANDPILFVHGRTGSASNWSTMISRFRAAGWDPAELRAFSYGTTPSNATIANTVSTEVNNLLAANPGKTKVDIVTHSMGGLSSRYYLKNLGGTAKVDEWVSLGGPNHGTMGAEACAWFSVQCRDMLIGGSFLTALNAGDETPGATNYGTFWSQTDGIVNPPTSTILSGATNVQTANINHLALLTDQNVFNGVRDFVD